MKKTVVSLLLIILFNPLKSQEWTELVHKKDINFYDLQKAFNDYWDVNDKSQKGRGYKAFKRWEQRVEPRVYPSGDLSLLSRNAANFQTFVSGNQTNSGRAIGSGASLASTTWSLVGPLGAMTGSAVNGLPRKAGRDNFITIHPTPSVTNTYWAGAAAGGLWKTTNNGTNWTTTTDNLTVIGATDLAVDPTNPNNLFLATGDGDAGDCPSVGVLTSTNGGATWSSTGLTAAPNNNFLIHRLIINPSNPQILLAGTNAGIYRTTNGGVSWTQINTINTYDLEFKPGDPTTVYAAGAYFYLSTNSGASFTQVTSGIATTGSNRMAIAVTTNSLGLNYVYVVASTSSASDLLGVYRSQNSGATFSLMASTPNILVNSCAASGSGGQGWYDLAIAASPLNADEVVVGGVNHWRSTNGGANWSIIGCWNSTSSSPPYVHADVHDLEYSPTGVLYSASDGGISEYTGSAWIDRTGSRNIAQIYRIGLSSISANYWITGHQDNGSNIYNGSTYNASYPGDGLDCFVDWNNNSNLFTETPNGGLVKSSNGGSSWTSASTGITESSNWLCPWKQNPQNANILYAGCNAIWTSTNQGSSWTSLAPLTTTAGYVTEFAVAPSNSLVIYVLKSSGVFKTTNGGTSWTNVTGTIPVGSAAPTYVMVSPTNTNNVWVTLSGYSSTNKVYMTTNGGTSWTNVTYNLPNLPANCIVYEPGTNDRVYLGMDVGVYYKDNSTTSWTLYNNGLPNVVISDLEISPAAAGKIRAATYGRGVYEVDVVPCTNGPTVTVSNQSMCSGASATLAASGASTYVWSNGATTSSIVISPTLTTIYTVTGSIGNCTDTKTVSVTVNPLPAITTTATSFSICAGASSTISATGASSYTWYPTSQTGGAIAVGPTITTVYTVTGSNGTCAATSTIQIVVASTPTVTASASQTNICTGNCATLTATGASTFTWQPGNLTGTVINVCPTVPTLYSAIGSNGVCTATGQVVIIVGNSPTITTSSNQSICAGSCATLTASGGSSYTWNPGALSGSAVAVCPTVTTIYTLTGSNGFCNTTKTVAVIIGSSLSLSVNTPTLCSGAAGTLSASGATSYTWSTGSNSSSITVNPSVTTTYTVQGSNGSCLSSPFIATVNVATNPTVTVIASPTSVCSGGTSTLTASGATTYSFSNGSSNFSTVVVPLTSTTYTVVGTNLSGCSSSATTAVSVLSSGISLTVTPNSASVCAGGVTLLNASGASSYTWSNGSNSPSVTVSPTVSTVYTVTGSNGGCTGSNTATVTVIPLPTVTANSATICPGGSAILTANGASTYSWNTGSVFQSITVSPTVNTTYSVIGANLSGCVNTATANVILGTALSVFITSTPSVVCTGGTATLSASGASSYTWSTGSNAAIIFVSPASTTTYSLLGSSGTCSGSAVTTVSVSAPPVITLASSAGSNLCAGSSATLTASGALTYSWSNGSTGNAIVVSPSVSTVYTVTGSNGGCSSTNTLLVSVGGGTIAIGVNANPPSLCNGGNATLTANGATSYTWSTGSNNNSIIVSPSSTSSYTVNGVTGGCSGTGVITVSVGVASPITLSALPSNTVCAGGSATLSASGAYANYSWSGSTSTGTSIVITPVASGIYTVTGSGGGSGCTTTQTIALTVGSSPVSVISFTNSGCGPVCTGAVNAVTSGGTAPYSYSLSTGSCTALPCVNLCAGLLTLYTTDAAGCKSFNIFSIASSANGLLSSISSTNASCTGCNDGALNASVSGGTAPYTYTWLPVGGNAATASGLAAGCYTLGATDAKGCSLRVVACLGIMAGINAQVASETELLIYPNPATDKVYVHYGGTNFDVTIYNNLGQLITQHKNMFDTGEIATHGIAKGIYVMEVKVNSSIFRKKLILE